MRACLPAAALAALVCLAACSKEEAASPSTMVATGLPAPYDMADIKNGKKQFVQCSSCHTIKEGGANTTGPNLHGVFGRKVGSNPDFKYSDAVKKADFVWDGEKLDQWLEKPKDFLPGTKMSFPGVKEKKNRTDLIAYLMIESRPKP